MFFQHIWASCQLQVGWDKLKMNLSHIKRNGGMLQFGVEVKTNAFFFTSKIVLFCVLEENRFSLLPGDFEVGSIVIDGFFG